MVMSESEIVREYRAAKNKSKQIEVLAELNAVKADWIKDILLRNPESGYVKPGPNPKQKAAAESEAEAMKVPDTNGCYVVPAFTGLGAPHWDQYARGTIVGITRGVNRSHIIRATLDSLAYQTYDVLKAMEADASMRMKSLKVDGGASANNYLMQTQADIIDGTVYRPRCVETTAMGAAYLAGLAVGYWNSLDEIRDNWAVDRVFQPRMEDAVREERIRGWRKAVRCAYGWAKED